MLLQRPLEAAIEFAKRQGFHAFEVWADHPHAHPDETPADMRPRLRKALADFAAMSMHGPLGNASLASINPGIWRESLRQHLAAVELASEIGATVLVTHPGDLRTAGRTTRGSTGRRPISRPSSGAHQVSRPVSTPGTAR